MHTMLFLVFLAGKLQSCCQPLLHHAICYTDSPCKLSEMMVASDAFAVRDRADKPVAWAHALRMFSS